MPETVDRRLIDKTIAIAEATISQTIERVEAAREPIFQGENEFTRTIVTLSAGALVLSVSVAQLAVVALRSPSVTVLLYWSWVLFGGAVLAGGIRQQQAGAVRGYKLIWETRREPVRQLIEKLLASAQDPVTGVGSVGAAIESFLREAERNAVQAERMFWRAGLWMFALFALGLACLVAFAIIATTLAVNSHS